MSDASRPLGRRIDAEELLAHAAWLRGLARSLVKDEHAADDVVQETFAAAVSHPPRDKGALRGWLAKVARNAAWKSHRGDRRRADREQAAPSRGAEPSSSEIVERIETQRALLDAVEALEEPYRTVVMMRFYDGKPPREIARELGVTPEVVWQRLSRAIAMLRARLDDRRGGRDAWAGVFVFWLGGREAAGWSGATALGTGAAIMGMKTVVAVAAAAALAAWYLWPQETTAPADASRETAAIERPSPVAKPTTAPRVRPVAAEATPSEPDPSAVPRARTHGRVVDAVSGEPLAGARVTVIRKSPGGGFQWALTTGADGTFAGEADETASYSDQTPWSDLANDSFVEASAPGRIAFRESPWTGAQGEDLGDVKLERGRVVRGRVVDADGSPAPRAIVFVGAGTSRPGWGFPLQEARRKGTSDDSGNFELDGSLRPTTDANVYTLLAATPKGVAFTTLPIRKGSEPIEGVLLVVRVGSANLRVTGPDGQPVAGARVVAQPRFGALRGSRPHDPTLFRVSDDAELAAAFVRETGADGRAAFDALPIEDGAGVYDFGVTARECSPAWRSDCRVGSVDAAEFLITLNLAQQLVAGVRVVDSDGHPITGVRVTGVATPGLTDSDGVFVIARSAGAPGIAFEQVELMKEGYARRRWIRVPHALDDGRPWQEIRLERPAPVEGRIVDQDDRPIGGARVVLDCDSACLNLPGRGLTAADGAFSFGDATDREWRLHVMPPVGGETYVQPPVTPVRGGARGVVVRVRRLAPARANAIVNVIDSVTGVAMDAEDADLDAAKRDRAATVSLPKPRIDSGRVSVGPLRPGEYALWIRIADRPHQLVQLHVPEGATEVHATCRVRRGVAISGRIHTPEGFEGKPLRATYQPRDAEIVPGGGSWPITSQGATPPSSDGSFRVEGVTPTVYRLSIRSRGWYADAVVDASEGDATIELEARRGVVLRLRGSDAVDAAFAWIEGSLDGGPWFVIEQAPVTEGLFDESNTLPPGQLRWRAVFRRSFMANDVTDVAEPQSGELLLEAGKDVDLVIPVVPKK